MNRPTLCALTLAFLACVTAPMQAEPMPAAAAVAPHPDVQRALAYKLPAADCARPQMSRGNNDATAVERFQRSMKRYTECLRDYDETLYGDLLFLHGAIAQGASQAQAEQIGMRLVAVGQAIGMLKTAGVQLSADQQQKVASVLPAATH